jgi:predicted secreted hydrolase
MTNKSTAGIGTKSTNSQVLDNLTKQSIAHTLWMKEYDESKIPSEILEKINSEKNSNESFTFRFCKRIEKMMTSQLSFVTGRKNRYLKILENAEKNARSPQSLYASNLLLGPESVLGYEPLPSNLDFDFTKLDLPQLKTQVGWHFFVGNYKDSEGNNYSVEFMFWHYTQLPPELASRMGLSDLENQTVEMHLAICDPQNQKQYRATTSVVAGTTGLISVKSQPVFEYRMGNNAILGLGQSGTLFPVRLVGLGYDLSDEQNPSEIEIDIALNNKKGYFLEGEDGFAPSVDGIGTLYYSSALLTLMEDRESSLKINGKKITLKEGRAWYDHQWGTGFMPNGAPQHAVMRAMQNLTTPAPGGWEWFMFQFYQNDEISTEGEIQICVSALHTNDNLKFYHQTGANPPGIMKAQFTGKFIDAHNNVSNLTGEMQVVEWTKVNFSPNPKVYPPTDTWYPNKYQFTFNNLQATNNENAAPLPKLLTTFIAEPLIHQGAQTGFFGTGLQYTEGGIIVRDINNNEIGRGFAEGTNWSNCNKGVLELIGLPVNQETLGYFSSPKISFLMKLLSKIEVLFKANQLKQILKDAKGL